MKKSLLITFAAFTLSACSSTKTSAESKSSGGFDAAQPPHTATETA